MNLWIILTFAWISLSSVLAEPTWFVQDTPLEGEEQGVGNGLFPQEQLILVQDARKVNKKSPAASQAIPSKKQEAKLTKQTPRTHNETKKITVTLPKLKGLNTELVSENFLPAQATVRKPLRAPEAGKKAAVKGGPAGPVESTEDEDDPCDTEKDIDCLMMTEGLILVNTKKKSPPAAKTQGLSPGKPGKPGLPAKTDLKKDVSRKSDAKPKVVEEPAKSNIHRRLLQAQAVRSGPADVPLLQPMLDVGEEDEDELAGQLEETELRVEEEQEIEAERIVSRMKRQVAVDEETGSGDNGVTFIEETTTTDSPVYGFAFNTTLEEQLPPDQTLSELDKANYSTEFTRQLEGQFQNFSGFQDIIVFDVRLDEDRRITFDWDIVLSVGDVPGNTSDDRINATIDFLTSTVVPTVNEMTVHGQNVYFPKRLVDTELHATASLVLGDICLAQNACPSEYECWPVTTPAVCRHKCFTSGLINACINGGSCQLDDNSEPYCQCGEGFEGLTCEVAPQSQDEYSTGQIVGASAGSAVMLAGALGGIIYFLGFRKKKEEDMEYSYFGDDDSTPTPFQDANSSLGISNYYIDRPSVSVTPINLYE